MTTEAQILEAPDDGPGPEAIPDVLPILPLPEPVFPMAVVPMAVGNDAAIRLIDDATRANRLIGLVALRDADVESPGPGDMFAMGTAARILQLGRIPDGSLRMAVQGLERIRIGSYTSTSPYLIARVEVASDLASPETDTEALRR